MLLRTDPSPQTTVKNPPAAVHLVFSEAVEVAFGAVRVFDVDGKRVDKGKIQTANGRREVVVPASFPGGTYTVSWRVVSADGHPVHGGFQFYVGAPSTISAVAVMRMSCTIKQSSPSSNSRAWRTSASDVAGFSPMQ